MCLLLEEQIMPGLSPEPVPRGMASSAEGIVHAMHRVRTPGTFEEAPVFQEEGATFISL